MISILKRVRLLSNKYFISYCENLINQAHNLLDRGLSVTCSNQMREIIGLCENRKNGQNGDFWWLYGMAYSFLEQALSRFGRKSNVSNLDKAQRIAKEHNFFDVEFWVNKSRLDYTSICGRYAEFQKNRDSIYRCIEKIKEPAEYEALILPVLSLATLNQGIPKDAQEYAQKALDIANSLGKVNLQIQSNILLGKALSSLKRLEGATKYFQTAISLTQGKKAEQIIPALYSLGESLLLQGKISEAKSYIQKAQRQLQEESELSNSLYNIHLARLHGSIAQKEDRHEEAEDWYNKAITIAQSEGNNLEEGLSYLKLGGLFRDIKEYDRAEGALENASAKFIMIDNKSKLYMVNEERRQLKRIKEKTTIKEVKQEEPRSDRQRPEILDEFMKVVLSNLNLDAVLNNAIEYIMKITNADRGFLILLDEKGKLYSQVIRTKVKLNQKQNSIFRNYSRTVTEEVLKTKKSILVTDAQQNPNFSNAESVLALDIQSVICVPLKKGRDEIVGLIYIDRHSLINAFSPDDLELVELLSEYAALALLNARLHSGIQKKLVDTEMQLIQSEKMATMGILAGGVAHEINNPLGAILINAEMLLKEIDSKSHKDMLSKIEEGTRRCKNIVEMLLQYSRKTSAKYKELDLNSVIDSTCAFLEDQLRKENISLVKEQDKLSPILGNANELMQVFTNLILNAKEAIKSKIDSGKITIKSYQETDFIVAQVIDEGIGIPEENLGKIFDPFFTTKDVGKGTGLGLSILYRIVENHYGSIEVASKPGVGTTFTIKLPLKQKK